LKSRKYQKNRKIINHEKHQILEIKKTPETRKTEQSLTTKYQTYEIEKMPEKQNNKEVRE
jgi:hypothetical protein